MKKIVYFLVLLFAITSCRYINQSNMLRTPKDFKYDSIGEVDSSSRQYRISINDVIEFRMFSNDGFRLIDLTAQAGTQSQFQLTRSFAYDVEYDGTVKFPVIGRKKIIGLSIREAENLLQEEFSKYYNKPFVLLNVTSKKVFIFPGSPGDASVVQLITDNTTLIEVLARAGGIAERGKARKVKLIRGDQNNRKVYLIDLSKIEGLKQGDMVLQSNDIIYVEPRPYIVRGILTEISPILSLISSTISVIALYKLIK